MKFNKQTLLFYSAIAFSLNIWAHPMPNSVLLLDLKQNGISAELKLPLKEMQYAVPFDVINHTETLTKNHSKEISDYLIAHIHPLTVNKQLWTVEVNEMHVDSAQQTATGMYKELTVHLYLIPPPNSSSRQFILYYDAIVHQVVTHKILVSIRQDFDNGKVGEQETEVGIIYMNPADNTVSPLEINVEEGSMWKGFKSMVSLGMQHIAEGTDHLLFLLVLLLAAPMIASDKRWTGIGTTHFSIVRLLKIVTAFTIGHSITLIIAASGLWQLPAQPVEVLIAVSILVSGIHAVRPIFPNKETFVAAGFGLIHGLAFASVLSNLHLETGRMVLSVLGFNIGIELMQLFVVLLTFPWLLILSATPTYQWVRIIGATLAAIASVAWIIERILQKTNPVSSMIQNVADHGKYFMLALACVAIVNHLVYKFIKKKKEDK